MFRDLRRAFETSMLHFSVLYGALEDGGHVCPSPCDYMQPRSRGGRCCTFGIRVHVPFRLLRRLRSFVSQRRGACCTGTDLRTRDVFREEWALRTPRAPFPGVPHVRKTFVGEAEGGIIGALLLFMLSVLFATDGHARDYQGRRMRVSRHGSLHFRSYSVTLVAWATGQWVWRLSRHFFVFSCFGDATSLVMSTRKGRLSIANTCLSCKGRVFV